MAARVKLTVQGACGHDIKVSTAVGKETQVTAFFNARQCRECFDHTHPQGRIQPSNR